MRPQTYEDLVGDVLDEARRGWIHRLSPDRKAVLANHLSTATPRERARVIHADGDGIAEREIDDVWTALGHQPTTADYVEMAKLLRESARYCLREARKRATEEEGKST